MGLSDETFLPSFAIINNMYLDNNDCVLFERFSLNTLSFDEHYYAFEVERTNTVVYVSFDDLLAPVPNNINVMPNLGTYVTSRWCLDWIVLYVIMIVCIYLFCFLGLDLIKFCRGLTFMQAIFV